jgi:hypothetical protein
MYSEDQIEQLHLENEQYYARCCELQSRILILSEVECPNAKEHLVYGVARRLSVIRECLRFFFDQIPPELKEEADIGIQTQSDINLHAFLINCAGIGDNIAWFFAYRNGLDQKIDLEKKRQEIGLFNIKFREHLPKMLGRKVDHFQRWHAHIIDHRHPTAHRIPPYVIPYIQFEDTGKIDFTPHYIHAFDKSHPILLHKQCLCDIGAVVELVEAMLEDLGIIEA